MARGRIQTLEGNIDPDAAGFTLVHEHLWAAFGSAGGDADLELTCEREVQADVAAARDRGLRTVVDVTAYDMGADASRTAAVAQRAGVRAVKSTGWFRSPSADTALDGRAADELAERLVTDLTEGFPGTSLRAGCLGEVGMAGKRPTRAEAALLEATAAAARATGAGIVIHTDDAENGAGVVAELLARGVAPGRLLVGHARVADSFDWQLALCEQGSFVAFDQVGHPARDPVDPIAERILALAEAGAAEQVALSGDVGRRSRLRAFGGDGYATAVLALVARLRDAGVPGRLLERLSGGAAAAFLAMPVAR